MPSLSEHFPSSSSRSPCRPARLIAGLFLLLAAYGAGAGTLSVVDHSRWVKVGHVYDGDTFRTERGEKVRLLGINTPEAAYNDRPGQPLAEEAKTRLHGLIAGRLVRLETDRDKRDGYGRTLAQVYRRDGSWINGLLVREGYAFVYTFAPNFRWAEELLQMETAARSDRLGIWKTGRFRSISSSAVSNEHIGQFRLVAGPVSTLQEWTFRLDGLMVSVPATFRHWFKNGLEVRNGQKVTVRGRIRVSGRGRLYLALHSPYDIE